MRRVVAVCAWVTLSLTGCLDAIGPGGDCSRRMREVREQEPGQPEVTRSEFRGDFNEQWKYPHRIYTFRWGVSYQGCSEESAALDLIPLIPERATAREAPKAPTGTGGI